MPEHCEFFVRQGDEIHYVTLGWEQSVLLNVILQMSGAIESMEGQVHKWGAVIIDRSFRDALRMAKQYTIEHAQELNQKVGTNFIVEKMDGTVEMDPSEYGRFLIDEILQFSNDDDLIVWVVEASVCDCEICQHRSFEAFTDE